MLKDKKQLLNLITGVKENKLESLELLHVHFSDFIKKYAYKYNVDIPTLEAEFDFILLYIINKNLNSPEAVLKYLNICFKNFKNFNIDKVLRKNTDFEFIDLDEYSNVIFEPNSLENTIINENYPKLNKIIKPDMIEILEEKFIDKLTCKSIGDINKLSKQRISQKIISSKTKIENELNYN